MLDSSSSLGHIPYADFIANTDPNHGILFTADLISISYSFSACRGG